MTLLGIEIGGTKLQVVVGDGATIFERFRFSVSREEGGEGIRRQIKTTLKQILPRLKPAAVGVGFGGPVDTATGKIACSHQIEGWSEFPLRDWLQSLTGIPVAVDNDANVAAYGEARYGAGAGFNPVFYVTLGSGVGGGLVVDGQIYHGAAPGESEIGHVRLDKSGRILESSCSGWAMDRKIAEAIKLYPQTPLAVLAGNSSTGQARFLVPALEQSDSLAQRLLEETAEDLAFGLSHVVQLMHPEVLVLGGGLSLMGEPLREAVGRHLPNFLMDVFTPGPRVVLAQLKEDAVPAGALALALENRRNRRDHQR